MTLTHQKSALNPSLTSLNKKIIRLRSQTIQSQWRGNQEVILSSIIAIWVMAAIMTTFHLTLSLDRIMTVKKTKTTMSRRTWYKTQRHILMIENQYTLTSAKLKSITYCMNKKLIHCFLVMSKKMITTITTQSWFQAEGPDLETLKSNNSWKTKNERGWTKDAQLKKPFQKISVILSDQYNEYKSNQFWALMEVAQAATNIIWNQNQRQNVPKYRLARTGSKLKTQSSNPLKSRWNEGNGRLKCTEITSCSSRCLINHRDIIRWGITTTQWCNSTRCREFIKCISNLWCTTNPT